MTWRQDLMCSPPSKDSLARLLSHTPSLCWEPFLQLLTSMRLLTVLSWAGAVAQVYSASPEAHVYLSGKDQVHHISPSISPRDARLLFAQRLGVSSFHSLGDVSESTLEVISRYSGSQQPLFHEEQWQSPSKLLVIAEGVEHPEGIPM